MSLYAILKTFGWKNSCPIVYRRFVDYTVLLFWTKDHVEKFQNYLKKQHKNIKFTSEIEETGSLSFLDITITRKFLTSVYRKPTFSGVFTNFESFIPEMHKRGLIETLLQRIFRLYSSYGNFHQEIQTLKSIFKHNSYPQNFVNQCIKKFLNKLLIKKDLNFMVPKRKLFLVLPYLGEFIWFKNKA